MPGPHAVRLMSGPAHERMLTREPRICRWPHCGMTAGDEMLFELVMRHHAEFIRNTARSLARTGTVDADDLVQEALIKLWRLGATRAVRRGDGFVRAAVIRRMMQVRRGEWRGWGRGREDFRPED